MNPHCFSLCFFFLDVSVLIAYIKTTEKGERLEEHILTSPDKFTDQNNK